MIKRKTHFSRENDITIKIKIPQESMSKNYKRIETTGISNY